MISEDLQNKNDNLQRYRERLTNFSKEFEIGLFIYYSNGAVASSAAASKGISGVSR